jgi:CheY-like chemotaxis protein
MEIRILLADDSPFWREQLRMILEDGTGWTVYLATNGAEAVQKSIWIRPDAIILDEYMPVLDGLSAAREVNRMWPEVPVLIVTADKTAFLEMKAREVGALAVFSKMDFLQAHNLLMQTFLARAA